MLLRMNMFKLLSAFECLKTVKTLQACLSDGPPLLLLCRMMIIPEENVGGQGALAKHAKKIFLSSKPAPVLESKFKDSDQFQLGTLSHIIGRPMSQS